MVYYSCTVCSCACNPHCLSCCRYVYTRYVRECVCERVSACVCGHFLQTFILYKILLCSCRRKKCVESSIRYATQCYDVHGRRYNFKGLARVPYASRVSHTILYIIRIIGIRSLHNIINYAYYIVHVSHDEEMENK